MKNLIILVLVTLISITSFAAGDKGKKGNNKNFCNSSLEVIVANHGPFRVKIDGKVYEDLHNGSVINDIPAGKRYVKVVQFRSKHRNHRHNHRPQKQVLYEGFVAFNECQEITAFVSPSHGLTIKNVVNLRPAEACNSYNVVAIPPNQYVHNHQGVQCNMCNAYSCNGACNTGDGGYYPNHPNNTNNPNNYLLCNACNGYHAGGACVGGNGNNNNDYYPPNNGNNYGPQPMANGTFNNLLKAISERSFDSQRIKVAQLGIEQNYFTSSQVRQIMNEFSFDNKRLDVAKMAYSKVVDRENYNTVFSLFSFDSSVEELVGFMRNN